MSELLEYMPQFTSIFSRNPQLSDIKPSAWAEKNIIIPGKGRLNYDFNPYCCEVIDTMAPDHPARKIAVMKGSQITFSSGVIMPILGYIIKEDPHNTYLMVGTEDLVKMAVEKLDHMIHGAKLQDYISYQIARKKNNKSGDTDEIKSFPNGYIKTGAATNPKSVAQVDLERILLDDFDAMKGKSKAAGSFVDLIEMRAAANMNTYKLLMVSTPLIKGESNIEPAYEAGDRRRYFIDCPCCHKPIILKWVVKEGEIVNPLDDLNNTAKGTGGIVYEVNNHGQLIKSSVGYVCYLCAGYFQDKNKQQMLRDALWMPTGIPISDDYFSYHISSLYAPVGMFNWAYYAGKYIEANPPGQPRDEYKMQVLTNTCFGETFAPTKEELKATMIMSNQREYLPGTIPESLSIKDGNGKIVLLTCGADLNGVKDDARLDYEIVAWSETGASYSVLHGSIGTFVPREGQQEHKTDRKHWTYEHGKENSVWPEFDRITRQAYQSDTGFWYKINMPGVDIGHLPDYVFTYMDWTIGKYPENPAVGMRGNKEDKYRRFDENAPIFMQGKQRTDAYWLQVGILKDRLSNNMQLRWDKGNEEQPPNFMNYPQSANGLYQYENFFSHYEAEQRELVEDNNGGKLYRWVKKNSTVQNHLFDCRIYAMAAREIIVTKLGRELKEKEFTWVDFVRYYLE